LKTLPRTRKNLAVGSLLLGAVLLITPAIAFAQSGTTYVNSSGANATVNVTNNQNGAYFNIDAAGSCPGVTGWNSTTTFQNPVTLYKGCMVIPFVSNYQLKENTPFYIYSVGGFIVGSNGFGPYTEYPQGYGINSQTGYYYPGSSPLQYSAYGVMEYLYQYLASLHSIYMFTGLGTADSVNLNGGLTADTYSITTPGPGTVVTINSGLGNSTYNIVVGQLGTVNINSLNSASAFNYYNIVY